VKLLSDIFKVPSWRPCSHNEPNPERLAMIITEDSPSAYIITHFDPIDPVIVSEA
jgi:hypothetical protein